MRSLTIGRQALMSTGSARNGNNTIKFQDSETK